MTTPPPLQKGDTIALASPARFVTTAQLQPTVLLLESFGFQVRIDPEVFNTHHQFGGTDEARAAHFNRLLHDPDVKAIIGSRGGYGSLRMADLIDIHSLSNRPKWLVGYSDLTVLHACAHDRASVESLHAPMGIDLAHATAESQRSLVDALSGKSPEYFFMSETANQAGMASGKLLGGNLSMLYSLAAAGRMPDTDGCILFIEDVDEYLYHIDRMLLSLDKGGYFEKLSGLLVGAFTDMHDHEVPFGQSVEDMILEHCGKYGFPIAFGFEAGHQNANHTLVHGRTSSLQVSNEGFSHFSQNT